MPGGWGEPGGLPYAEPDPRPNWKTEEMETELEETGRRRKWKTEEKTEGQEKEKGDKGIIFGVFFRQNNRWKPQRDGNYKTRSTR